MTLIEWPIAVRLDDSFAAYARLDNLNRSYGSVLATFILNFCRSCGTMFHVNLVPSTFPVKERSGLSPQLLSEPLMVVSLFISLITVVP